MYVVRCCTRDEGRPFAVGLQGQAANHLKLLWPKATVVSVEEKASARCQVWITKVSVERTNVRIENFANGVKIGGATLLQDESRGNLSTASMAPGVQLARA